MREDITSAAPGFICDCMCKGAALCLRAFGYYSYWEYGIEDSEVIRIAMEKGLTVVTGDRDMLQRNVFRNRILASVFIPVGMSKWEQFYCVLSELRLKRLSPRCMKCGGVLAEAVKEEIRAEIPPRTYAWLDVFFRCTSCGSYFWEGTHWHSISRKLAFYENKLVGNSGEDG